MKILSEQSFVNKVFQVNKNLEIVCKVKYKLGKYCLNVSELRLYFICNYKWLHLTDRNVYLVVCKKCCSYDMSGHLFLNVLF